jgi:hypothetical protein
MPAISIRTCAAFNSSKGMADCTVQLAFVKVPVIRRRLLVDDVCRPVETCKPKLELRETCPCLRSLASREPLFKQAGRRLNN